ncbi:two-component system sensor histidine kinase KdpD [Novosphingobium sp. PhB57]|uniref:DUF4118 domain-containing protein n=1 Tax=Novosphingobium sp. PhB57 TaxID=2485107 RepID=UPI00104BDBFD|nr:DUF4118 domain-containing protein [Novosphingobium sp. PhB57]TCU58155.1 two-component system sensor histidine kinase KdpD [Novosphingobium sp. PhB57]
MTEADRPSPEALLRAAAREGRGRLKIFLGAAPGVGKTWEMLTEGRQRREAGADVIVGVAETHGRRDTEALLGGHEIIPRRQVDHRGHALDEMDLDAILERCPGLVLVDELAHSNAPGSRHPKRYQDVVELLDAGIDVYSTLNIQHVESLNDVVASFTRVRVRETVPDSILEQAEIEVVDIPPDELIERLRDGKVYIPHEATRALGHFFSKSNLTALRELALRRAAQAVDAQMLEHLRAHALAGSFAAGDRIMVAIGADAHAAGLVRAGKRLADALRAPWSAVHIETRRDRQFREEDRRRLAEALALASRLGASTASIPAVGVVEGLRDFARQERATQLVIGQIVTGQIMTGQILPGKSHRSHWRVRPRGSAVDRLLGSIGDVAIHVLPFAAEPVPRGRRERGPRRRWGPPSHYLWSLLMVAAVTAAGRVLVEVLDLGNIALLFLVPVMFAAATFGLRAGLFTGLAASLAYNFFFLPPTGTLTVSNPENVVSILVLLGVAFATSQFAARVHAQAELAGSSARQNAALAGFSRRLTAAATQEALLQAICAEVARLLDVKTVLLLPTPQGPELRAAFPPEDRLGQIEIAAAQWALDRGLPAGRGSATLTASDWLFHPLRTARGVLGVLGIARSDARDPLRSDRLPLLMSLLDQASIAFDRMALETEHSQARRIAAPDGLNAALVSALDQDLRSPLSAIVAAARDMKRRPSADLAGIIETEAARLDRLAAALIDLARLETGALPVQAEATDLFGAVADALHETRRSRQDSAVTIDIAPGMPPVRLDPVLLRHCLVILLNSAGGAAEPELMIRCRRLPDAITLSIIGAAPQHATGSARVQGIVKAFARAMDLSVDAAGDDAAPGPGFTIRIPAALIGVPLDSKDLP